MVDISMIAGALSSLKAASDLLRGFSDLRDQAAVQSKVIELQGKISDAMADAASAQASQLSMLDEIRSLRSEIEARDAWDAQAARYALRDYGGQTYAYELAKEDAKGEPQHRACPACFEKRQRSILQYDYRDSVQRDHFKCLTCKSELVFGTRDSSGWSGRARTEYDPFA